MWNLPPDGEHLPLYRRIIQTVEQALASGLLSPEERLPSERTLSKLLGVNRSTVIRALEELTDRGVLLRRVGSGTYVNPEKWGMQSYPVFNWQPPPERLSRRKNNPHALRTAMLIEESRRGKGAVFDLSRDDVSGDLLSFRAIPKLSWQDLISAEQGEEAPTLGLESFRLEVRRFLRDRVGLDAPFERILVTSGTRQAIFLLTQCLLRPGDAVGVEAPSYFYSLPVFQAAGLRLYALPLDSEGVSMDGLDALNARRALRMIFINPMFQNPTGSRMSARRKRDLLEYCSARHIPIVEDDAYSQLSFEPGLDVTPLKALDTREQVIYAGSLSSYAGRSLRAGWMVGPESLVARLAGVRHLMDAGLSALPQILAQEYLAGTFTFHQKALRAALAARADALYHRLEEIRARGQCPIFFDRPRGGLYLYAQPERGTDGQKMLDALLDEGIIAAPGWDFGDPSGGFRLNFSHFSKSSR